MKVYFKKQLSVTYQIVSGRGVSKTGLDYNLATPTFEEVAGHDISWFQGPN
ncbi:hypothetical protein IJU97_04945 [bacterium]|nr:hypothetical protein [bacterium]